MYYLKLNRSNFHTNKLEIFKVGILFDYHYFNEPSIQAIFIRKIVSKFDDSRSMVVYVIRHKTESLINICSVPIYYTPM